MASVEQYPILEVPGISGLRIPLSKSANTHDHSLGTEIPDWVVSFRDDSDEALKTESTLSGTQMDGVPLTKCVRLCGFLYDCSHNILESPETVYYPSGTMWASTIHLVLQNGKHKVYITKAVSDGLITPIITIARLVRVGEEMVGKNQTIDFKYCHWNYITSANDFIVAGFTAIKRTNTVYQRKQTTGVVTGQTCTITNYGKNTVNAGE
ncbi:MAG: hypothetical protein LBS83_02310 [Holosporales bacterium]|jgi:hypothetical protein|nr:hypothetical protein [Holosporales bacterium]